MGIAEHELTHALGRFSLLYSNLGNHNIGNRNDGIGSISICVARRAAVFCGTTNLFLNQRWRNQPGQLRYHFRRGRLGARENPPNSFNAYSAPGVINPVSTTDMTELSALGFDIGSIATPHRLPGLGPIHLAAEFRRPTGGMADARHQASSAAAWSAAIPAPPGTLRARATSSAMVTSTWLWQNDDGLVAIWNTSALAVIGGGLVSSNPGPSWHIAGARTTTSLATITPTSSCRTTMARLRCGT